MNKEKRLEIGRIGGLETLRKHGLSHYSSMGKLGGRPLAQPPTEYQSYPIARGRDIGRNLDTNLFILLPCELCKKERWVRFIKGKPETIYCRHCATKARTSGRRVKGCAGYIQTKLYPDDFFYPMAKADGYVMEHRLVMAKHLGRYLQPWEAVHHKDGNRANNDLSNLEITTKGNHISDHNKGYSDGLAKGFQDGRSHKIRELETEIVKLKAMIPVSNP